MKKLPRKFKFPFGRGKITEEVSIKCPHWEPTIQLLEFDNGEKVLRFCYYHGNRFGRSPMMVNEKDFNRLVKAARKSRKINEILKSAF